jgi:D-tagatose-1,6-bisphosphate aldolase subunit GatZ/KbaZ
LDQLRVDKGALQSAMEAVMLADPSKWQGHYTGSDEALYQQRHFGLADRIRYYWPTAQAQSAVGDLLSSFDAPITDNALQNVFDSDVLDRAANGSGDQLTRLIDAHIRLALEPYFFEDAT